MQVVTGHRYLGGFIGDCGLGQEFVLDRMDQWCKHVNALSAVAASQLLFVLFQSLYSYNLNRPLL